MSDIVWTLTVDHVKSNHEVERKFKQTNTIESVVGTEDIHNNSSNRLNHFLWKELDLLGWKPLAD